jgi:hypothetical protein
LERQRLAFCHDGGDDDDGDDDDDDGGDIGFRSILKMT